MIEPFENYLKTGRAKKKTSDPEEAKALFKQAKDRMEYIGEKEINQKSAKFILQDSYETLRESAQALMSIRGFKPYSHEATIAFIKENYKEFNGEEINKFDHFRQLRNDSVYKAVEVSEEEARDSRLFAKKFIRKVQFLLKKNSF